MLVSLVVAAVDAHHDGDIRLLGRRAHDHLLGARLDVPASLLAGAEQAGALQRHVDPFIEGDVGGLEATSFFEAAKPMICFNADCCIVEVDATSGEFEIQRWVTSEDVGNVINPMIVDGQMHGAIVQGLSNAMFEEFVYDEYGQQLTADFENYKLATAADVPDIEITYATTPCPHTPLGTRGIGEGRPSSVPGALTNAVCDALLPFGVEITDLPLRPDRVWAALQQTKKAD